MSDSTDATTPEVADVTPQAGSRLRSDLTIAFEESYEGVLPHPSILKGYEEILPGATDRILSMTESQSKHRQDLESFHLRNAAARSWAGLACGFVITMTFLGVSAFLIVRGHGWEGTILGTVDIVALVSVFVIGRRQQEEERVAKAKEQERISREFDERTRRRGMGRAVRERSDDAGA